MDQKIEKQLKKISKPKKEVERSLKSIRVNNKVWNILDKSSEETGISKKEIHKLLLTTAAYQYQAKAKAAGGYASIFTAMVDTDNENKNGTK